jgi:hypothetical protein
MKYTYFSRMEKRLRPVGHPASSNKNISNTAIGSHFFITVMSDLIREITN